MACTLEISDSFAIQSGQKSGPRKVMPEILVMILFEATEIFGPIAIFYSVHPADSDRVLVDVVFDTIASSPEQAAEMNEFSKYVIDLVARLQKRHKLPHAPGFYSVVETTYHGTNWKMSFDTMPAQNRRMFEGYALLLAEGTAEHSQGIRPGSLSSCITLQ